MLAFRKSNLYTFTLLVLVIFLSWVHTRAPIKYVEVISRSMADTLIPGDRLIFWLRDDHKRLKVKRGDILLLRDPEDHSGLITKRLIGLPAERIRILQGLVYVNGALLHEPYLDARRRHGYSMSTIRVPRGCVFVLGDNRANSRDSATWGPVPFSWVEGRALACYWPYQRIGGFSLKKPSNPRGALSNTDKDDLPSPSPAFH